MTPFAENQNNYDQYVLNVVVVCTVLIYYCRG